MKQNKTGGNLSKGQSKNTAKSWKDKAQERAKENRSLKKRNAELVSSRNLWKKKYQSGLLLPPKGLSLDSSKAKHHQYNLWFVLLLIEMQKYGVHQKVWGNLNQIFYLPFLDRQSNR